MTPLVSAAGYVRTHRVNNSSRDASLFAQHEAVHRHQSWHNLCLGFVAHCYGFSSSGVGAYGVHPWAINLWNVTPKAYRHAPTTNIPAGGIPIWAGRNGGTGHTALSIGHRNMASNDIERDGYISIVPIDLVRTKWNMRMVGWIEPNFGKGSGVNPYR